MPTYAASTPERQLQLTILNDDMHLRSEHNSPTIQDACPGYLLCLGQHIEVGREEHLGGPFSRQSILFCIASLHAQLCYSTYKQSVFRWNKSSLAAQGGTIMQELDVHHWRRLREFVTQWHLPQRQEQTGPEKNEIPSVGRRESQLFHLCASDLMSMMCGDSTALSRSGPGTSDPGNPAGGKKRKRHWSDDEPGTRQKRRRLDVGSK
ncbi:hypothetical protein Slin15195_G129690 [Septoria linicola]|uniref:Uncharacterized protein n=1 Tax=Septoria linicola TaxID=215465 RepID=A0A9Q9B7E5_9PEZI|nr:hypothetical protein Slin14017_G128710 [Septoria linicola]USW59650.1 hypothetical protein Slin15195_G129690 [Septoria linicola]